MRDVLWQGMFPISYPPSVTVARTITTDDHSGRCDPSETPWVGAGHRETQKAAPPQMTHAAPSPLVATHSSSRVQVEDVPLRPQKAALPVVTRQLQMPKLPLPHTNGPRHESWLT